MLDGDGFAKLSAAEAGAFYTLAAALTLGLLERAAAVRVHWCDGGRLTGAEVSDAEQCREMLYALYRSELSAAPAGEGAPPDGAFRLTAGLALYRDGRVLRRFSARALEREIGEGVAIS